MDQQDFWSLTDLNRVVDRFGHRWDTEQFRMLDRGILDGKFYLAAYALACGATGLAFVERRCELGQCTRPIV